MSSNERIEAIRKIYKSAEWLEDDYGQTLIDVEKLGEVLKHAEALAAQVERLQAYALWLETEWCRPDWEGFRRRFPLFLRRDHNIQDGDLPEPEEP